LGEELKINLTIVVAKLKAELNELSNSLKTTLEARGSLEEKLRQVTKEVYKAKKEADV